MINYLKDLEHIKYTDWLLMSLLKFGQIHSDEKYWFHFHMTTRQTGNPRKHNFISDKFCFLTSNSLNTLLMKCWIFFCRSYPVSSHEILPHCRRCRARPCTRYDQILASFFFFLNLGGGSLLWQRKNLFLKKPTGSFAQEAFNLEKLGQYFEEMRNKMTQELTEIIRNQDLTNQAQWVTNSSPHTPRRGCCWPH